MRIVILILLPLFNFCTNEKPPGICQQFLKNNPKIEKDYNRIECIDSSHLIYISKAFRTDAFLAEIENNELTTTHVFQMMNFSKKITIKQWEKENSKKILSSQEKASLKNNANFPYFKNLIQQINKISPENFDSLYQEGNSLASLYKNETMLNLLFQDADITRKNDTSVYLQKALFSSGTLSIVSLNTGIERDIYSIKKKDFQGNNLLFGRKITASNDSIYRASYKSGDWVKYNAKRDSLAFFISDTVSSYKIIHYRLSGDTVIYQRTGKAKKDTLWCDFLD